MKKQRLFLLCLIVFTFLLCGCNTGKSASEYVGEQITSMKEGNTDIFSPLLEQGIAKSSSSYALSFTEELKADYLDFLQTTARAAQFKVSPAKKTGKDTYSVTVTFAPLDIRNTMQDIVSSYQTSMASADLTAETTALLTECEKAISDSPVYTSETYITLDVSEKEDGYQIDAGDIDEFYNLVFSGFDYMYPFESVCELLNARDFILAELNGIFKGDVSGLVKHIDGTEEELLAECQSQINFTIPEQFSSDYTDRYYAALKALLGVCQYDVGIPRKEEGLSRYTVDITVTPNNGLLQTINELGNSTFSSVQAFSKTTVEKLEQYAAAPVYGEPTVVPVSFSLFSAPTEEDTASFELLANTILPGE